jgi:hypothetical protein
VTVTMCDSVIHHHCLLISDRFFVLCLVQVDLVSTVHIADKEYVL